MKPSFFLFIILLAGLNTLAQLLLKSGADRSLFNFYLLGGLSAYGLSAIAYILILSRVNLSLVYPSIIGLSAVTTTIASVLLLKEKVYPINWVGISLIVAGIFALSLRESQ